MLTASLKMFTPVVNKKMCFFRTFFLINTLTFVDCGDDDHDDDYYNVKMMMRMMKSVQGRGAVGHRWGTHHYLHNYYPSITKSSSFLMLDIEQAGTNWPKCT